MKASPLRLRRTGPGKVVDVGEIVPVLQLPVGRLELDVGVESLAAVHLERRISDAGAELAELQRVGEVDVIAERRLLP